MMDTTTEAGALRLREVRHRVGNNLQLIGSILRLRRRQCADPIVQDELRHVESVIAFVAGKCAPPASREPKIDDPERDMARLQNQIAMNFELLLSVLTLRRRQNPSDAARAELTRMTHLVRIIAELQDGLDGKDDIDLAGYLNQMTALWSKLAWEIGVDVRNRPAGSLHLDGTLATSLAVAVFEVISNSIEHGFPTGQGTGCIEIALERQGNGRAMLHIADDGIGFRASEKTGRDGGMSIARDLVKSLGGSMEIASQPGRGTDVTIGFSIAWGN